MQLIYVRIDSGSVISINSAPSDERIKQILNAGIGKGIDNAFA
ncbi:hypothetical protein [Treponema sp.]